jgi:hypothetical protein
MEIILYAVPKSWIREMDRQGIDPLDANQNLATIVDFFERIEATEEYDQATKRNTDKKSSQGKKPSYNKAATGDKYCMLHGTGSHTSEECHKLKSESKRLKSTSDYSQAKGSYNGKSSNKNWSRKPDDKSNKELNAFVKKSIKEGVRKELNALQEKKRKASSDEEELAAIDVMLKEFNYKDMDNLKIDSDLEIDV